MASAAATAATVSACGADDATAISPFEVRDSLGIHYVEVPSAKSIRAPALRREGDVRIDHDFGRVTGGAFIGDSLFVVGDAIAGQLWVFDMKGDLVKGLGRKGQGPGEYGEPTVIRDSGDGIMVYDRFLRRLTHYRDGETAVSSLGPDSRRFDLDPLVDLGERRYLVSVGEDRRGFRDADDAEIYRDSVPLLLLNSSGETEVFDTLGMWLGAEKVFKVHAGGIARLHVGFGAERLLASNGRWVAIGSAEPFTASIFEDTVPRVVLTSKASAERPTLADRRALAEWREDSAPITLDWFLELWRNAPVRETLPSFGDIAVSDDGYIWLGEYATPNDEERRWVILGESGQPLAATELPAHWSILDIQGRRLAAHWKGEFNEDYVVIRSFEDVISGGESGG